MKFFTFLFLLVALPSSSFSAPKPGDFLVSGPVQAKKIALTFDDGPGPQTELFLPLLDKYQVKATFFMLGEMARIRPKVAAEVASRGHEIASHTLTHKNYAKEAKGKSIEVVTELLIKDMKSAQSILEKNTGSKIKLCRMPHGIDRPWIKGAAKEAGVILVNWTYGSDWINKDIEVQKKEYIAAIKPGAIILLHDGNAKRERSLALTEAVIVAAKEKGYSIVPVGELLGLK